MISFKIHYLTDWGQQVALTGNTPEFGNWNLARARVLDYQGNGYWGGRFDFSQLEQPLEYKYLLIDERNGVRHLEWGPNRRFDPSLRKSGDVLLRDSWRPKGHPEHALYTSAFFEVILRSGKYQTSAARGGSRKPVVQFRLRAPRVPQGCRLCILGSTEELGNWSTDSPLLLGNAHHPQWTGEVALQSGLTIEYKYAIYDPSRQQVIEIEEGENRLIPASWMEANKRIVISDEYFRHRGGLWKGVGVAIPVFSLRTRHGLGVGEFRDLRQMVDWAVRTGLKMVQILPANDTSATHTWVDSYPYAAISVFALHPLYLNIDALGDGLPGPAERMLVDERERLNKLDVVDYEAVMSLKLRLAREIFDQVKDGFLAAKEFRAFFRDSRHWLEPYAAFCYLRDQHGTVDFTKWGQHAEFSAAKLKKLTDPKAKHYAEIAFHYFLQYHLDRQLQDAAQYARQRGVILKGDIPIGIYRYSVDAWVAPELYNMNGQSGAPPDPFSETGQNWGFPTYNWEVMAKNGYQWWQQRLQQLSRYFDAFRIDHILGFFRIWEIPLGQVEGLMGHFNPALPVAREEFERRGIPFSEERYCRPYLPEHYLYERFGADADLVKELFLEPDRPYYYRFREEFNTQRRIEEFLGREENAGSRHLREGLFELLADVLFFEEPGSNGRAFHPRILLQKTRSFRELNPETQAALDELYVDYFFRRQDEFWRQQAMKKLPAIKDATNMLICGEDLGMVPATVPGVMRELDILSLEIQRMSKNPATEFLVESDIPYLSVCSPSTHDMSPLRAWWEEMTPDQRQRFYNEILGFHGDPPQFCEPWVIERILRQHLHWPSMWAVFPLQDIIAADGQLRRQNPFDERINVPANPKHYWRYRFHIPLEELLRKDAFNDYLLSMVRGASRL
jgi:4-alpha-glucanotransferase